MSQLQIHYIPLSQLADRFLERNGKRHDIDAIAQSIQRYGFRDPLALDAKLNAGQGGIAEGNGRLEALLSLRDREASLPRFIAKLDQDWAVPVIVGGDSVSESEGMAYAIDHNLSTLLGSGLSAIDMASLYEQDILLEVVEGLEVKPLTLSEDDWLDLEESERDTPDLSDLDEVDEPQPQVETRVQLGEIWQLGRHFLICGDSTDRETLGRLRRSAGIESVDLLLTDPPYNVAYVGKTSEALTIENDSMDTELFAEFLKSAFHAADQLMRPGAAFYIWHAETVGSAFRSACNETGWEIRQCLIWVKNAFVLGRQDYHWQHEPCLYGWKDGAAHLWNSDRSQSTVLEFNRPQRNGDHPTMKPVNLMAYLTQNSTKRGGWVLDPFSGSGSTLLACEETDRCCLAVELSPVYCDVILRRWEELTAQTAKRIAAA